MYDYIQTDRQTDKFRTKTVDVKAKCAFTAFTLAEVLITLGIIGVVAAFTIPTLMQNSAKQETVTKLEKAFSTISQAHHMAEVQLGSSTGWGGPSVENDVTASKAWWDQYFIPYANLSVAKTCDGSNASECWATADDKYLDGTDLPIPTDRYYLALNDGTTVCLSVLFNAYGSIYVDLNGLKKPNVLGKDIFLIILYYPKGYVAFQGVGISRTTILGDFYGSCNKQPGSAKGQQCGALIQQDGWQIKDDYPWN